MEFADLRPSRWTPLGQPLSLNFKSNQHHRSKIAVMKLLPSMTRSSIVFGCFRAVWKSFMPSSCMYAWPFFTIFAPNVKWMPFKPFKMLLPNNWLISWRVADRGSPFTSIKYFESKLKPCTELSESDVSSNCFQMFSKNKKELLQCVHKRLHSICA